MDKKPSVLDRILEVKRRDLAQLKAGTDLEALKERAKNADPPRDFLAALSRPQPVPVIAEIKKASPSAGALNTEVSVADQARLYQDGGAAALSVLTDGPFFKGSIEDLTLARQAVDLPVLRKDFIIDPFQVYEARAAGADAILLIVAALKTEKLRELYALAGELGLAALIEIHEASELPFVLNLNPPLIGINNRNLSTLEVSLETALTVRPLIGPGPIVVGESGISGPQDIRRLRAGGLRAFLVGTTLMKALDPAEALRELTLACG